MELANHQIDHLKALAAKRNLRYQAIVPGLRGEGDDRGYLNPILFDGARDGFSLLDIGSNLGYFCLEASARGAGNVVGVDPDPSNIELAGEIARIAGSKASYLEGQFEDLEFEPASFDVVACLNVLHHMYNPIQALHKMMSVTSHKVVLEFAAPNYRDMVSGAITPLGWLARNQAAIFLGRSRFFSDGSRTFMFPREAVRILFNEHTALFEPVRFTRSPFKGRWIAEAVRRRIGHLVLVAGPTSVGKSTFQTSLERDEKLREQVGIAKDARITFCNANLLGLPTGKIDTLVVHYDMLRPHLSSIKSYERDIPLQILIAADEVTSLALVADEKILQDRITKHELSRFFVKKRHRRIFEDYANPNFLPSFYTEWTTFCDQHENLTNSLVVKTDAQGGYAISKLDSRNPPWRR